MAAAATATDMTYLSHYTSPLGEVLLAADDLGLTGLWFDGQKYFAQHLDSEAKEADIPLFQEVKRWLDLYFSGEEPDFLPPVHLVGTAFQRRVWDVLLTIPYGETMTYGQIAAKLGCRSAQAVGGAVGRNPISIIVPCHRVVGVDGSLTGYAGGVDKKIALLELERAK